ncbi:MAG: putative rane protein [Solirubrobacterales bacterium]|nr:putative rane protein [Solirubrobacterales bacterium]
MAARWGRDVKTLDHAWREFRARRSPKVLAAGIAAALVARFVAGDVGWRDVVAVAAMLAVYPFGEWAIHVYLLHMPPFEFRGRSVYLQTAKSHWAHHKEPRDLDMILLAPIEAAALLGLAVPAAIALIALPVSLLAGPVPLGTLLTALLTGFVLVGVYEWTHFLIHTAHRPRSRLYRAVWQTHRLHHFKNEHYWHGITSTVADRVLGTAPDHRDVPRSRTARTLDVNG